LRIRKDRYVNPPTRSGLVVLTGDTADTGSAAVQMPHRTIRIRCNAQSREHALCINGSNDLTVELVKVTAAGVQI
jgi:hypothetical protein